MAPTDCELIKTFLMCKLATTFNPEDMMKQKETVAFVDVGSCSFFADQDLAKELNLPTGEYKTILIRPFKPKNQ